MSLSNRISCVFAASGADLNEAGRLADALDVPILFETPDIKNAPLSLRLDGCALSLIGGGQAMCGDFTRMLPRIKRENLGGELLVKAAKIKGLNGTPTAVDATAGTGEDAFLLAASGFQVKLFERDPVIAALLRDAIKRAADVPELAVIAGRMKLSGGDSLTALPALDAPPDVVLLDPMFPARQKSALIKKKFQLLQMLESPCTDESELLEAALACRPLKIVIKRPIGGEFLAGRKPDYSIKGSSVRYDCIVLPRD